MKGFALFLVSTLALGCVGQMGESNTLRFKNLTDDPGQPVLFSGAKLNRPVAVNATIELEVSNVSGWKSVISAETTPPGIFTVESLQPIRLRALSEGTATLEVTAVGGLTDRIELSASAIETVDVDIHRSTLVPELPSPLYESWATPNGFALRPGHALALEATARNAAGQILMGIGAIEWEISDESLAEGVLNTDDNTFDVQALGAEGEVTISAGYGSSFALELASDAPADHLIAYDLEGQMIDQLVHAVGQNFIGRVYAYDANGRLLIGSVPEETALTFGEGYEDMMSDLESREAMLYGYGLLLLHFEEPAQTTLTVSTSGAQLVLPLTVVPAQDPQVATR